MTWNKDNPRFRRSSFAGGSRRKKNSLISRIGGRFNGLFKSVKAKTAQDRPHPVPPPELAEDLKIAIPKKNAKSCPPPSVTKTPPSAAGPVEKSRPSNGQRTLRREKTFRSAPKADNGASRSETEARARTLAVQEKIAATLPSSRPAVKRCHPKALNNHPALKESGDKLDPAGLDSAFAGDLKEGLAAGHRPQGPAETGPDDDYKINRLGRERRKRVKPQRNEKMEAGLGCDPAHLSEGDDSVCAPPKKPEASKRQSPLNSAAARKPGPGSNRSSATFLPSENASVFDKRDGNEDQAAPPRAVNGKAASDFKTPPKSTMLDQIIKGDEDAESLKARKIKERRLITLAFTAFAMVITVLGLALFLFVFKEKERPVAKVARLPQASLPKVAPVSPGFFEFYALERAAAISTEIMIEEGGSLGKALETIGLGGRQGVGTLINYMTKDDIVPVVQPGDTLRAFWTDRGKTELARLEYLPNPRRTRADLTPLVIMRRPDGGYWHYRPSSPLLTLSAAREATIESSLWAAGSKVGLDAGIITSITEILASDVDFMTNIQRGDTFQVLYSRDYRDGQPKGEPIIDMIKLTNRGRSYEYYRYVAEGDHVSYFDPEGRSSRKAFFMTPLQYKRISSQFTMTRLHPIHKVVRPHQGVDFAAPNGTPVSTVADGTVIFCGWNGGYGKLVTIQHDKTYTTMYAHLSKFAPGIQKGSVVRQGDLIGYVGATGTATGPHLDFRMKKHGVFVDPLPVLAEQKGKELDPKDKQAFIESVLTPLRDEMTKKLLASREN